MNRSSASKDDRNRLRVFVFLEPNRVLPNISFSSISSPEEGNTSTPLLPSGPGVAGGFVSATYDDPPMQPNKTPKFIQRDNPSDESIEDDNDPDYVPSEPKKRRLAVSPLPSEASLIIDEQHLDGEAPDEPEEAEAGE